VTGSAAPRRLGRYEVFEQIGAGGMGLVLRGRDPELKRDVAIKALAERLRDKPEIAERFRREALALARLSHPNIVRVFDVGEEQGLLYYVMELLQGTSLAKRTQHADASGSFPVSPALDPKEFLATFIPIAGALEAVHGEGLVHRDLKPSNILEGVPGRGPVLIDFGIARLEGHDGLTADGLVMGTAQYIAPEQVAGQPADEVSDLFSLGATMWEFATYRLPFATIPSSSLLASRAFVELPPVRQIAASIPAPIAAVIDRCCRFQREKRFGSAGELRRALEAVRKGPSPAANRSGRGLTRPTASLAHPRPGRRRAILSGVALAAVLGLAVAYRCVPTPQPAAEPQSTAGGLDARPPSPVSPTAPGPGREGTPPRAVAARIETTGTVLNPGELPASAVGLALLGERVVAVWLAGESGLRTAIRAKGTWSTAVTTHGPKVDKQSGLVLKAVDGRALLAWTGTGPAGVPCAQTAAFDPRTSTWSEPSSLGPAEAPDIQLELSSRPDGTGPALVAWEGPTQYELSVAWQLPGNHGWTPSRRHERRNRRKRFAVAQNAGGQGLVVWQQKPNESAAWQLMASRCAGPKGLWLTPTLLKFQSAGINTIHPALASTGNRFHLAWSEVEFLIHPMMTASSDDGGRTFGAPARLSWPYGRDPHTRLAAAGDQVWAVFSHGSEEALAWAGSTDRGRTWSRRRLLGSVGDQPNATALAVTPAGEAWLLWADDRGQVRIACLR
jgi:serine/threonine-protein kinase